MSEAISGSSHYPACRFAHAGYLLDSSHPRHSGMRREAQTRNPLSCTMSGEWIPGSLALLAPRNDEGRSISPRATHLTGLMSLSALTG
jgi:hypothetical protein